jgi:hypothetical protein
MIGTLDPTLERNKIMEGASVHMTREAYPRKFGVLNVRDMVI